jgi:hypothetical protein
MSAEDMTPKPTIDPESPTNSLLRKMRRTELANRIPKYEGKDYRKMYYTLNKYRKKQEYEEDPDPFASTYVFYCFQGKLEE